MRVVGRREPGGLGIGNVRLMSTVVHAKLLHHRRGPGRMPISFSACHAFRVTAGGSAK
jgi:hypothetical protein